MMARRPTMAAGPIGRRWLVALLVGLMATLAAVAACGGSSEPAGVQFPTVIILGSGEVFPIVTNRTLAVGENRLSLRLVDREDTPVLSADLHLRFFDLNGGEPLLKSEADARFIPVELSFIDEQFGRKKQFVGQNGVYVAQVDFDAPGQWRVEIAITLDGRTMDSIPFRFNVLDECPEPAVGEPAPPSRQLTLADVAEVTEIDSSYPSRPHMHDVTVAGAMTTGQPIVAAFATPAFCHSRTCGPVLDTIMDPLYEKYSGQVIFIHIEPYRLKELRENVDRIPVEAMQEWDLQTEPWVFVIDRQGKIASKFEGIVALDEVESVLQRVLEEGDGELKSEPSTKR